MAVISQPRTQADATAAALSQPPKIHGTAPSSKGRKHGSQQHMKKGFVYK